MTAKNRLLSVGGMLMIGDALAAIVGRTQHLDSWRGKGLFPGYNRMLDWFKAHPAATVAASLGEAIAGIALIKRAEAI